MIVREVSFLPKYLTVSIPPNKLINKKLKPSKAQLLSLTILQAHLRLAFGREAKIHMESKRLTDLFSAWLKTLNNNEHYSWCFKKCSVAMATPALSEDNQCGVAFRSDLGVGGAQTSMQMSNAVTKEQQLLLPCAVETELELDTQLQERYLTHKTQLTEGANKIKVGNKMFFFNYERHCILQPSLQNKDFSFDIRNCV